MAASLSIKATKRRLPPQRSQVSTWRAKRGAAAWPRAAYRDPETVEAVGPPGGC